MATEVSSSVTQRSSKFAVPSSPPWIIRPEVCGNHETTTSGGFWRARAVDSGDRMNVVGVSQSGRFAFGPWWLLYAGSAAPTAIHTHHAYQLVVHTGASLVVDAAGHLLPGPIVVIEPDAPHALQDRCDQILIVYIAPESAAGRQLATRHSAVERDANGHSVQVIAEGLRADNWSRAEETVRRILAAVCDPPALAPMSWWRHPEIDAALPRLHDLDDDALQLSVLAGGIGLPSSRLAQVLTDEIGMPVDSYIRWMRLVNATEQLAAAVPINEAARNAGYTDAAHFNRMFHSMFGVDPSAVIASAACMRT